MLSLIQTFVNRFLAHVKRKQIPERVNGDVEEELSLTRALLASTHSTDEGGVDDVESVVVRKFKRHSLPVKLDP